MNGPQSDLPKSQHEDQTGMLTILGSIRDGLLVVVGMAYVLGFLTISYYAHQHDLGLLPLLDAQYFLAGLLPALLIALAVWYWRALPRLTLAIRKAGWRTFALALILATLLFLALPLWMFGVGDKSASLWLVPVAYLAPLLLLTTVFAIVPHSESSRRQRLFLTVMLFLLCAAFLTIYLDVGFPKLPEAIGGIRLY